MFGPVVTVIALVTILILVFAACAARRGDEGSQTILKWVWRGTMGTVVVLAVLAVLAIIGPMGSHGRSAPRNRTMAVHRAVMAGLESYYSEFGEYPQPVQKGRTIKLDGQTYEVDSALMLYQAMTGDGNDAIVTKENSQPSDGRFDNDLPARPALTEMPKAMWRHTEAGYIIVDAFGHPFQYDPAAPGSTDVVNRDFDLWSFGEAPPVKATKAVKQDPGASSKWIKNF